MITESGTDTDIFLVSLIFGILLLLFLFTEGGWKPLTTNVNLSPNDVVDV